MDPDIKEGGAYIEWVWCSHVAHTASAVFLCVDISQGVVGGSGAHSTRKNFEFRLYKSVSEAIKDHHKPDPPLIPILLESASYAWTNTKHMHEYEEVMNNQ